MDKAVVFAHFDRDGLVDDYVIYYLRELRRVCRRLVFVSDCALRDGEAGKLDGLADHVIAERHGEYDFGSYKRGFAFAAAEGWLEGADELIFANDSCYGPFFPFAEIFDHMSVSKADAWSIRINSIGLGGKPDPHMQSYFLVLRPRLFLSPEFASWIGAVTRLEEKEEIIRRYEIGFSRWLLDNGFAYDGYVRDDASEPAPYQIYWTYLIGGTLPPIVKKAQVYYSWSFIIGNVDKYTDYPSSLIVGHRRRTCTGASLSAALKRFRKWFLRIYIGRNRAHFLGRWYYFCPDAETMRLCALNKKQNKAFAQRKEHSGAL